MEPGNSQAAASPYFIIVSSASGFGAEGSQSHTSSPLQQTAMNKEIPQPRTLQEPDSQTSASWSPLRDTAVLERGDQLTILDTFTI